MKHEAFVFDIDGVLADFLTGFTSLGRKMFNTPVTDTHAQPSWNGFPGITKAESDAIWKEIVSDDEFWFSLHPLVRPEVFQTINIMQDEHDVYFVTARPGIDAKLQTEAWLRRHGIMCPTVIISKAKGEVCKAVRAKAALEDKAANASCIAWITEDRTQSYLINRKYNQCPDGFLASSVKRVATVEEYLAEVQS